MELLSNIICEIENLLMNRDGAAMCFAVATCVLFLCEYCCAISKCGLYGKFPKAHGRVQQTLSNLGIACFAKSCVCSCSDLCGCIHRWMEVGKVILVRYIFPH